jgi:glycerol-3-phosphate acyltransferase PlsY
MVYAYSIGATLLAYLLGSLSFAVIVSKLMGLSDPRSYGSKNPGATNVLRSGSKPAAILTLLLDGLKGWLPVVLVKWFGADYGLGDGTVAAVGFAAFLGHLVPGVLPVQGRQGRGDGGGRAAGRPAGSWAWRRWPPG